MLQKGKNIRGVNFVTYIIYCITSILRIFNSEIPVFTYSMEYLLARVVIVIL